MEEKKQIYISFVTAVRDEEGNLPQLHKEITQTAQKIGKPWEVIYIENGSKDNSLKVLKELPHSKTIVLRWNRDIGKTAQSAALDAGIKASKGQFIATLDSDLEDDPSYIPLMIDKLLKEDADCVAGWRQGRKDPLAKKLITAFAKFLRKRLLDDGLHDSGCTLRVYRRECFEDLDLYGEMHRYIGALLKWRGFKIAEIKVQSRKRKYGASQYKASKALRGFVDLFNIWFWKKYSDRPIHIFGVFGLTLLGLGTIGFAVLAILRIFYRYPLSNSIWPVMSLLSMVTGLQLFVTGILADQLVKNYYSSGKRKSYLVKEVIKNE